MTVSIFRSNPTHRRLEMNKSGFLCVNVPISAKRFVLFEDAILVDKGLQRISDPRVALALHMIINYPDIISTLESAQWDAVENALNKPETGGLLARDIEFLSHIHDAEFMNGLKVALLKVLHNNFVVADSTYRLPVRLVTENGERKFHSINGVPVHHCIVPSLGFVRRSSTPNCKISHKISDNGRVTVSLSAISDIKAGDELTISPEPRPKVVLAEV